MPRIQTLRKVLNPPVIKGFKPYGPEMGKLPPEPEKSHPMKTDEQKPIPILPEVTKPTPIPLEPVKNETIPDKKEAIVENKEVPIKEIIEKEQSKPVIILIR